jgi:glutamate transport system permease protein
LNAVLDNLGRFANAFWLTVAISVVAFAGAFVLGNLIAIFRVSPVPPLRWAGTAWVEGFRNTPLLVLLVLFYFGLSKVDIKFSEFWSAVIVCSVYTSAFVAETARSGFNAVPPGQAEAARALGLTFPQVLSSVIVPQALRTVVGPMGSVFIALIKNSSLAFAIAVATPIVVVEEIGNKTAQYLPLFLAVAAGYLLLTIPVGQLVGLIERRVAIRR